MIVIELGPLLTAAFLCGHIGASLASELASLRATGQADVLVSVRRRSFWEEPDHPSAGRSHNPALLLLCPSASY